MRRFSHFHRPPAFVSWRGLIGSCCLVLLACACGSQKASPGPAGKAEEPAATAASESPVPHSVDIGDVEASLTFLATLPPDAKTPNAKVDEMINMKGKLDMTTVTIQPPLPTQLKILFTVKSNRNFTEFPVALRAKVFRDKDPIATFSTILGANAIEAPYEQAVDVFAGLNAVPETLVVHAQAELIPLPKGADPATADVATLSAPPEQIGNLLSSAVRIVFQKTGGGS